MIIVDINQFMIDIEYYVDFALNGEPIEVVNRSGKALRLELKENKNE